MLRGAQVGLVHLAAARVGRAHPGVLLQRLAGAADDDRDNRAHPVCRRGARVGRVVVVGGALLLRAHGCPSVRNAMSLQICRTSLACALIIAEMACITLGCIVSLQQAAMLRDAMQTHVAAAVQVADLLPESLRGEADKVDKGTDTMDVWFDSGSSWAGVSQQRDGLRYPADLYLEGSDQHRCASRHAA